MATHDALGTRMKEQYENRTRYMLPRRTYTIIRVDGRAFHSLRLKKPFDMAFMERMNGVGVDLCGEIQGAQFAFVQSDEVSVLVTDFEKIETQAWFDGNVQKMASIAAACATKAFGEMFDARVFTIPDPVEVENYFIWRQKDAVRNSVSMLAQSYYSHKELEGKDRAEQHEMIYKRGDNWAKYPTAVKHGRCIIHTQTINSEAPAWIYHSWRLDDEIPEFTKDRAYLAGRIPLILRAPVVAGL